MLSEEQYANLEFVDDVTDFRCVNCQKVAINHFFSNCDHVFCAKCHKLLCAMCNRCEIYNNCLKCQIPIIKMTRKHPEFGKKMLQLRVCCPHTKNGCKVTPSLTEMSDHIKQCQYVVKPEPMSPEVISTNEPIVEEVMNANKPIIEEIMIKNEPIVEEIIITNEPIIEEIMITNEPIIEEIIKTNEPIINEVINANEPNIKEVVQQIKTVTSTVISLINTVIHNQKPNHVEIKEEIELTEEPCKEEQVSTYEINNPSNGFRKWIDEIGRLQRMNKTLYKPQPQILKLDSSMRLNYIQTLQPTAITQF